MTGQEKCRNYLEICLRFFVQKKAMIVECVPVFSRTYVLNIFRSDEYLEIQVQSTRRNASRSLGKMLGFPVLTKIGVVQQLKVSLIEF
jgi:hypothetical protein